MYKNKPIKVGKRDQLAEFSVYCIFFSLSTHINKSTYYLDPN